MTFDFEMVVAFSHKTFGIGTDNKLPWYIPNDLKHFRLLTEHHIVIMGKNTYNSLPSKCKPLSNRINIVLTNTPTSDMNSSVYMVNLEELFILLETFENLDSFKHKRCFVIGGEQIYNLFFPHVNKIHATCIYKNFEKCNSFINKNIILNKFVMEEETDFEWCPVEECSYKFQTYERLKRLKEVIP